TPSPWKAPRMRPCPSATRKWPRSTTPRRSTCSPTAPIPVKAATLLRTRRSARNRANRRRRTSRTPRGRNRMAERARTRTPARRILPIRVTRSNRRRRRNPRTPSRKNSRTATSARTKRTARATRRRGPASATAPARTGDAGGRRGSAPHEGARGALEHRCDVGENPGTELAVDEPVIEAQRELGDPAGFDLALVHPRALRDRSEGEDRRLAGVEDRGAGIDAEDPHVGDRHGAILHRRDRGLA